MTTLRSAFALDHEAIRGNLLLSLPGALPIGPDMAKKIALFPKHPERICWGCDKYCAADALACGNGSGRTPHPIEMLGDDWLEQGDWGFDPDEVAKARARAGKTEP